MFVRYIRELLRAEESLTGTQKVRMAARLEKWALNHNVRDPGRIHEVLDLWVEDELKGGDRRVLSYNAEAGEDTEFVGLMADPKAENPMEVAMTNEEGLVYTTGSEARGYIDSYLDDESRDVLMAAIEQNPDDRYTVDAEERIVREHGDVLSHRIRKGRILTPKKVIRIGFSNGRLVLTYQQGFDDDTVNRALLLYAQGYNAVQIAERLGLHYSTTCKWLYQVLDLPRVGRDTPQKRFETQEILRLYEIGNRPQIIGGRVGCGLTRVYDVLKEFKGLDFGWGGPDPWVYELTGQVNTIPGLKRLGRRYGKPYCWIRYRTIFDTIRQFQRRFGRGPSVDELRNNLGINPWYYLDDLHGLGVLKRRRLNKEHYTILDLPGDRPKLRVKY